jgi:methyl-accepting chemotaxis protein
MNRLDNFQQKTVRILLLLVWSAVPLIAAMGWWNGRGVIAAIAAAIAGAALSTYLYFGGRSVLLFGMAFALAFVSDISLAVYILDGHPWQIDMHYLYFAALAMLSGFCDWRISVFASGLILLHHLTLNFLLPFALFPGGADFLRVLFHGTVVLVESATLITIGREIRKSFTLVETAKEKVENSADELKRIGTKREEDLSITTMRADVTSALLNRFQHEMEDSIKVLHGTAQELQSYTDVLNATAARANNQSIAALTVSEETTHGIGTAVAASEQLTRSISEVGSNATRSSKLAADAVQQAETTNVTIDEMAAVAAEINKVTDLISSIAEQTNLLALNATIEAARAGEAGKGFAVVAQEVKALASQTAAATQEISSRIEAMQTTTSRSVSAIQAISATIRELDQFSAAIVAAVEEQASVAHEITANVSVTAAGVDQIKHAIGDIETIARNTAAAASTVGCAALQVTSQTSDIRSRVDSFSGDIQAVQVSA